MDYLKLNYNDLLRSIEHWNEYRVPILRISNPDKNLNFKGAMRFYFQDAGQKVATKCVNVSSKDTTKDVIDVLIEKFRPDMRMLSVPEYGLYEIHENGDERKLEPQERPIFVQLEWNKDDREGRFLLRRMDEKTRDFNAQNEEPSLKRKLSKKEKKKQEKLKKQQLKEQEKADAAANKLAAKSKNGIAEKLYNELPETSFTRSISNPEAVMKRRRAQKLEKRLQEFSLEGGQEAGGTLRIFGEAINKDVSYTTLLLSTRDTSETVIKQLLEKYGKEKEDPANFCLVQLIVPSSAASGGDNNSVHSLNTSAAIKEYILDEQDCPLLINQTHDHSSGVLTFHIRPKPADYHKRRKKKPIRGPMQPNTLHPMVVQQLNQRLQMNNNSENYRDQNSPQNSSQTSGSLNHDMNNPPPPPFESIHSVPTMFSQRNGNNPVLHHQVHSMSASTLPAKINNITHPYNLQEFNGAVQHLNYNPHLVNHPIRPPYVNNQQATMPLNNHNPYQQQAPSHQYVIAAGVNGQILPALIQVSEDVEDIFLSRVITHIVPNETPFRLAPTYTLYMVSRYRASTLFRPELQAPERAAYFVPFTNKIATIIRNAIESHMRDPSYLAFWLANSSYLSHFYEQDRHLSHFTIKAQKILFDSIKASFKYLLSCKKLELDAVVHTFFDEREDFVDTPMNDGTVMRVWTNSGPAVNPIIEVLSETMATMRKNRTNAALTIQIYSHLFHHISKWLFDRLMGVHDNQPEILGNRPNFAVYCNRRWGEKLTVRLAQIGGWAEKQGLEQTAEFHLAKVSQVISFLSKQYTSKLTPQGIREACDKCDRLNPVQMRALLQRYQPEHPTVKAIINNLLFTMDYRYMAGEYPLEEDSELDIPFLIPEDGYSLIRYIPKNLLDFVSYLSRIRVKGQELCVFTLQPTSSGYWSVYFKNNQPDTPDIVVIQLKKKNDTMGLSIVAAKGVGQDHVGIYIRNTVKDGAADLDGRIHVGDQLLEVDGNSLIDLDQEQAAELMKRTGPVVTLKIAKQAAIYHDVIDFISSIPSELTAQEPPQMMVPPPPLPPMAVQPQSYVPPPVQPPPPPQVIEHVNQRAPTTMQSPVKWPKKQVSWVDNQPHQSLHTLIPLNQDSEPTWYSGPLPNGNDEEQIENNAHNDHHIMQHRSQSPDDEETSSDDQEDDLPMNGGGQQITPNGQDSVANGQVDVTTESLTLEDIDEVLSSRRHNNWMEDTSGVIGTQEVYNDPRQRIVRERERASDDVNIEKLSFQEKLKMFNISSKK